MQLKTTKRQREQARTQRQNEKSARRAEKKKMKAERGERVEGEEDPDIAGIIPGPQPLPEGF